jgi:hypothetical protein
VVAELYQWYAMKVNIKLMSRKMNETKVVNNLLNEERRKRYMEDRKLIMNDVNINFKCFCPAK